MINIVVDYIWISDSEPYVIGSRTRILHADIRRYPDMNTYIGTTPRMLIQSDLEKIPVWENGSFVLRPVKLYKNGERYITICEQMDNTKPLLGDCRTQLSCLCVKHPKSPTKVVQELLIFNDKCEKTDIYGMRTYGENIMDEFVKTCLDISISVDGVSQEDYVGKWSYQLSSNDVLSMADDLLVSRFVLHKMCNREKETVVFELRSGGVTYSTSIKTQVLYNSKLLTFNNENNPYKMLMEVLGG